MNHAQVLTHAHNFMPDVIRQTGLHFRGFGVAADPELGIYRLRLETQAGPGEEVRTTRLSARCPVNVGHAVGFAEWFGQALVRLIEAAVSGHKGGK